MARNVRGACQRQIKCARVDIKEGSASLSGSKSRSFAPAALRMTGSLASIGKEEERRRRKQAMPAHE
jgi:hypothetical protein